MKVYQLSWKKVIGHKAYAEHPFSISLEIEKLLRPIQFEMSQSKWIFNPIGREITSELGFIHDNTNIIIIMSLFTDFSLTCVHDDKCM